MGVSFSILEGIGSNGWDRAEVLLADRMLLRVKAALPCASADRLPTQRRSTTFLEEVMRSPSLHRYTSLIWISHADRRGTNTPSARCAYVAYSTDSSRPWL
ncbi:hypothetical protein J1614_005239 [Plenodomus biglobosus]|nr:hypothetical protein J1614_005239 [Plenodomus biglobosus]